MKVDNGTKIEGFEIIALLGVGGMGAVYKARQLDLNRFVALKFLDWKSSSDDSVEVVARFKREAQALSVLRHKHIVSVYSAHHSDRYGPFLVMEFVRGQSMQDLLSKNVPMEPPLAIKTGIQILEGLAHAHAHGIVHRDIKPNNIIMGEPYGLKIIDFGLVKLLPDYEKERQTLTEAGFAIGSVLYMSPEQCKGQAADERSDIYAVGCVLHHCLTGLPPFNGEHSVVVMNQHVSQSIPALSAVCPERTYPEKLQDVLLRATAKEATERYQSASAMIEDLQALAAGEPDHVKTAYFAAPTDGSFDSKQPGKTHKRDRKRSVIALLAIFLTVLLSGFGIYIWSSEDQSRKVCQALTPYLQPGDAASLASFCESHNNKAAAEILRQHVFESMSKQDPLTWADAGIALMLTQQANENAEGARTTFNTVDGLLMYGQSDLARAGKYKQAARFAEKLVSVRKSYQPKDDVEIASALMSLGYAQDQDNDFSAAENTYRDCLRILSVSPDPQLEIKARSRLAIMLASQKRLAEADREARTAIDRCAARTDLTEDILDFPQSAVNVVAPAEQRTGNYKAAEDLLKLWKAQSPKIFTLSKLPAESAARYAAITQMQLVQLLNQQDRLADSGRELTRLVKLCEGHQFLRLAYLRAGVMSALSDYCQRELANDNRAAVNAVLQVSAQSNDPIVAQCAVQVTLGLQSNTQVRH